MKKFVKYVSKVALITTAIVVVFYAVVFLNEGTYINEKYENFTSIHDGSVIIGTSRSKKGIQVDFLEKEYNFKNYSFDLAASPYDRSYVEFLKLAIQNTDTINNISILDVSPNALSHTIIDNNYFSRFDLKKEDFKKINLKYLITQKITPVVIFEENLKKQLRELVYGKNGEFDFREVDKKTINTQLKLYLDQNPIPNEVSARSLNNIADLIGFLKKTSRVVLIRMPTTTELYKAENRHCTNFNSIIDSLAKHHDVIYRDLNKEDEISSITRFIDISHMNGHASIKFTEKLNSILATKSKNISLGGVPTGF
jgi:hypothetical protein